MNSLKVETTLNEIKFTKKYEKTQETSGKKSSKFLIEKKQSEKANSITTKHEKKSLFILKCIDVKYSSGKNTQKKERIDFALGILKGMTEWVGKKI